MAETGRLKPAPSLSLRADPVLALRVAIIVAVLVIWEAVARSGLLYRDVVPSLFAIGGALVKLLTDPEYYWNLGVTAGEVGVGPCRRRASPASRWAHPRWQPTACEGL